MDIERNIKGAIKKTPVFSDQCFWDMDYKVFDFEEDKRFIIGRVLSRGSSKDEKELFNYYGWETIKEEVVNIKYLNNKILNYLSVLFGIKKEQFRCYENGGIY